MIAFKNGVLKVILEDDSGVDDQDIEKSFIQMPCHLGSYILGQSKRLLNNVIREINGFYGKNVHYGYTDGAYILKKHWDTLVEKGYVEKRFGLSKNGYGIAGIFYDWFLAQKIIV